MSSNSLRALLCALSLLPGMPVAADLALIVAQDDQVLHFGLGSIATVDVIVDFVDGSQTVVSGVPASQRILIDACSPPPP